MQIDDFNCQEEIKNYKVSDIIKIIEHDGWCLSRQNGSHRQYKHDRKIGLVTISNGYGAFGDTKEETEQLIYESIKFHIEGMEKEGLDIPQSTIESELMIYFLK